MNQHIRRSLICLADIAMSSLLSLPCRAQNIITTEAGRTFGRQAGRVNEIHALYNAALLLTYC
jgi:hypothetical protein